MVPVLKGNCIHFTFVVMHQPALVSVVLATFNGEQYIAQQLDSLISQTYPNMEIIAVDDCSSDNTVNILRDYAVKHNCIKLFVNETNLGFIKNFEKGCLLASGAYISLCDQDDAWHPDKIKILAENIGDAPMAYCDSYLCSADLQHTGKKISDVANLQSFNSCLQQAVFCRIYGHATLFTRNIFLDAKPFLTSIPHDWWLSFVASVHGPITYIDQPLVYYRQHATNLFGAVGGTKRKHHRTAKKEKKKQELKDIRSRINSFYQACPEKLVTEKRILQKLSECYENFSFVKNMQRMLLFLRYSPLFLAVKKRSAVRKWLFCFKMFFILK